MTYSEETRILQRALEIAQANGFELNNTHSVAVNNATGQRIGWQTFVYDHAFAKALWGDKLWHPHMPTPGTRVYETPVHTMGDPEAERTYIYGSKDFERDVAANPGIYRPRYQWHLMEMVVAPEPLAYLRDNLPL